MDLLECAPAHHHAIELMVVADDGLLAARATHVKFEAVSAVLKRKIEREDGVFRLVKAGAAMSEK